MKATQGIIAARTIAVDSVHVCDLQIIYYFSASSQRPCIQEIIILHHTFYLHVPVYVSEISFTPVCTTSYVKRSAVYRVCYTVSI